MRSSHSSTSCKLDNTPIFTEAEINRLIDNKITRQIEQGERIVKGQPLKKVSIDFSQPLSSEDKALFRGFINVYSNINGRETMVKANQPYRFVINGNHLYQIEFSRAFVLNGDQNGVFLLEENDEQFSNRSVSAPSSVQSNASNTTDTKLSSSTEVHSNRVSQEIRNKFQSLKNSVTLFFSNIKRSADDSNPSSPKIIDNAKKQISNT